MDGYNTHGDAVGKQGKAVEKMFVQAFKEATQGKEASLDVYPDTLIAFDKLLPKLRKFVDGTLTDKSVEQLTDELVGIVDKALKYAKGEKKAQPLIESWGNYNLCPGFVHLKLYRGRTTVKTAPSSGALATATDPWHNSTMRLTNAKPKPFPSAFREGSP